MPTKAQARRAIALHAGKNDMECYRCGHEWERRPHVFKRRKEAWLDTVLKRLGGKVYSFQFAGDRERFRAILFELLDEILIPRVCPRCKSSWWDTPRVRVPIGHFALVQQRHDRKLAAESKV